MARLLGITREVNARKSRTDQSWFRKGSEKVSGLETTFWADRVLPQGQPVGTSSRRLSFSSMPAGPSQISAFYCTRLTPGWRGNSRSSGSETPVRDPQASSSRRVIARTLQLVGRHGRRLAQQGARLAVKGAAAASPHDLAPARRRLAAVTPWAAGSERRGWQRGERSLVLKLCSHVWRQVGIPCPFFLPKNCGTSSVIVEAGTREEAEFVAAVQYDFPSGTRVLDANPYNIYSPPPEPRLGLYWECSETDRAGLL